MKRLFAFIMLLLTSNLIAQTEDFNNMDFTEADSVALSHVTTNFKDYQEAAQVLSEPFDSDILKYRSIFRWIAETVEYQFGRHGTNPSKIFKTRRAVCEGYSSLLEAMSNEVGLECKVIIGFAKSFTKDIPINFEDTRHAWNAIKINGQWYLSDVTWASSALNERTRKFIREFDPKYFISDPNFFALQHYPEDSKWWLTPNSTSKKDFKREPVKYRYYNVVGLRFNKSPKGLVTRTLKLKFSTSETINNAGVKLRINGNYVPIELVESGQHNYQLKYPIPKDFSGSIYLYLDNERTMGFRKK